MNVLSIVGTNRKEGTVSRMCERILEGARESGHHTDQINLYDYDIQDCLGCWQCHTDKKCHQQDDFESIFDKIKAADTIILGSPVYWGNITGKMKVFFDRHMGYAMYNPKDALDFQNIGFFKKSMLFFSELRKFGPKEENLYLLRPRRFLFLTVTFKMKSPLPSKLSINM